MASISVVAAIVILYAITLYQLVIGRRKRHLRRRDIQSGLKQLPGPKGLPIIGSIHQIPEQAAWLKFAQWGKQYGPIYQVNLAGSNHIWISTDKIAKDLLAKKSAIYSDRPHIPALLDDNRTSAQYLPLLSRNDAWARQRKFAKHIMDLSQKASFHYYPELEQVRLLAELIKEPTRYNHCLESYISRVTCRLAWGVSTPSDELKQRARELLIGVSPTGALGNKLAFLMSLPDWLVPAKAWERRRASTERRFFQMMQDEVQADMEQQQHRREAPSSWMSVFLKSPASWRFQTDLEGAYAVGMHGIAGALTIAAPMQTFCLALCYYPQYQPMLQEEIDRVCGDRRPQFSDAPDMPVVRAFIREALRWRPPVPTGIPHEVTQNDMYEGFHIPAGSVIHPLEWSISREQPEFPDPEKFNPMRWLDPKYPTYRKPLSIYPTMTGYSQFGYGRRVCMGQGIAEADMFVGIAGIAWLFHLSKAFDQTPKLMKQERGFSIDKKVTRWFAFFNRNIIGSARCDGSPGAISMPKSTLSDQSSATESQNAEKSSLVGSNAKMDISDTDPIVPLSNNVATDPTLRFSHLLIAKPLPFEFNLQVRNQSRAELVQRDFKTKLEIGEFPEERKYWENEKYFGWGKV